MDGSSVVQENSPVNFPLQCVYNENNPFNLKWQDLDEKISPAQNSKLLFLMVEYAQDTSCQETEPDNLQPDIMENEKLNSFNSTLETSDKCSLYNTLVIPNNDQLQFQNFFVVLPTSKNDSQQISIVVNESEVEYKQLKTKLIAKMPRQLILENQKECQSEESLNTEKLGSDSSKGNCESLSGVLTQITFDQNTDPSCQKLIVAASDHASPESSMSTDVEPNINLHGADDNFFQDVKEKNFSPDDFITPCFNSIQNQLTLQPSNEIIHLSEVENREDKVGLNSSKPVIDGDLKHSELSLSNADQNNEMLIKSESLIEVDSYTLNNASYINSVNENSYSSVEEQLNISSIEKVDNEYLLPNAIEFGDANSKLLQSNLEVFASQVLDNNELFPCDKNRQSSTKKTSDEQSGIDYWCENCEFGTSCSRHEVKIISDKPVLSRARATLPKELLVINKLHANTNEEGVFARKTVMRRVQFGPVEGRVIEDWEKNKKEDGNEIELLIESEAGKLLKLDISDEHDTNWMRFVRRAKTLSEQNLILSQQGKFLYFTTTRVIPPKHELKVGYSPQYAERRRLEIFDDSWHCFECTLKFSSSEELQKHLISHKNVRVKDNIAKTKNKPKDVSFKGPVNEVKPNVQNENPSRKTHGKKNECWTCHKVFPRNYSFKRHLSLVHSEKNKENTVITKNLIKKCEKIAVCNTLFKKKQSNGTGSEWLCTHCDLTFSNSSVLNLHTLTHAAEDLESETALGLPFKLSSEYQEGEFLIVTGDIQCPQCTQEFSSKRELIDHVSTHGKMALKKYYPNNSKPYKCERCYKSFASEIRLQKHMLVHGSEEMKPYQCDTCFKRFLNNSALSCHLKTHNEKRCFECPLCKKEFKQVFDLKEHVKIHSQDGYFTCPHCSKVFDAYSVVRKHIRAFHSGHQHTCNDCGKLFLTLDKLRMHSLRHSDHREFLCANCGKQFKRKDKLKEHMKRMHSAERELKLMSLALRIPNTKDRKFVPKVSPLAYERFIYKCRNCMVGFKRRGMLVNHLAKRHPDILPDTVPELNLPILKTTKDYFCQYCDKIYKSSSKRKAHILKNHPGAELPMSNRQKGGVPSVPGVPNPTFSLTVGSVKITPHRCKWCHKQYASKAKLLQHQRKKHISLLPHSQQRPRPTKNPCSPLRNKLSSPTTTQCVENMKENNCSGVGQSESEIVKDDFNIGCELTQDIDSSYKKNIKNLPENISCELLQQAMTELSQSLSDYKLPFSGTQENIFKIIELKEGGEGITKEDNISTTPLSRTWSDFPPR